jgi:hypothetical protein
LTCKKKDTFKEAKQEIIKENIASTSTMKQNHYRPMYEIPPSTDHTNKGQSSEKVSNLKTFLQSCVKLLNDPSSIKVLHNLLDRCNMEVEGKLEQKIVNHLHTRRITSREFRLNENIQDFNMGDVILDLGSEVNVLAK